jgi:ADP-heptose:LPS heptosyltransferase
LRRDNIGDLVCTTPLIHALREAYPRARIEAFVNDYARAVVAENPDLDEVHTYRKSKHAAGYGQRVVDLVARARLIRNLRTRRYDLGIVAAPCFEARAARLMRWIRPRSVLAFTDARTPAPGIDLAVESVDPGDLHHCEHLFRLLAPLGLRSEVPDLAPLTPVKRFPARSHLVIGVHISSRKPQNRWPTERFISLLRELSSLDGVALHLLWSPGAPNNPQHPGDDENAARIVRAFGRVDVTPVATPRLEELIAALNATDLVVCSDGGAMHLAAALKKPIVCLFGRSLASFWHPWRVPYHLLQPPSHRVDDIGVEEVLEAVQGLAVKCGMAPWRPDGVRAHGPHH